MSTALDLYDYDRTRTAAAYDAQRRQRAERSATYDAQRQQRAERAAAFDAANPGAVLHLRARRLAYDRARARDAAEAAEWRRVQDTATTRVVDEYALVMARLTQEAA